MSTFTERSGRFMNKICKITSAIAAIALTAAFSSCAEDGGAADVTEAVTTSEITETTPETVMIPTTTCFVEDETEEEVQEPAEEYVQVSAGNEFIDFEFIEDYQGTADIGALADKAAAFMKESEEYKRSADSVESFTVEGMLKNPDAVYTLTKPKSFPRNLPSTYPTELLNLRSRRRILPTMTATAVPKLLS